MTRANLVAAFLDMNLEREAEVEAQYESLGNVG